MNCWLRPAPPQVGPGGRAQLAGPNPPRADLAAGSKAAVLARANQPGGTSDQSQPAQAFPLGGRDLLL
eukprot:12019542-Alexandrium_andersonii.AAC.1